MREKPGQHHRVQQNGSTPNPVAYSDPTGLCPFEGCWEQFDRVLLELTGKAPEGSASDRERELLAAKANQIDGNSNNQLSDGSFWYTAEERAWARETIDCWVNCYEPWTPLEDRMIDSSWGRCARQWDCAVPTAITGLVGLGLIGLTCPTVPVTLGATAGVCVAAGSGSALAVNTVKNATIGDPLLSGSCTAAVGGANPVAEGARRIGSGLITRTIARIVCS